jgi:hemerythrin superfamily protein
MSDADQIKQAVDKLVACEQRIAELRHQLVTTADSDLIEQLPPLYQRVIEHELDEHGRFQPG